MMCALSNVHSFILLFSASGVTSALLSKKMQNWCICTTNHISCHALKLNLVLTSLFALVEQNVFSGVRSYERTIERVHLQQQSQSHSSLDLLTVYQHHLKIQYNHDFRYKNSMFLQHAINVRCRLCILAFMLLIIKETMVGLPASKITMYI